MIRFTEKGGINIPYQPHYNNVVEYTPGYTIPGYTPNIPGYSPGSPWFTPGYNTGYTQVTNAGQSSGYNPFDG